MQPDTPLNERAHVALKTLRGNVEACDYRGYDPYDALNSSVIRLLTLGTKAGRIAWTQFMRRFPINLRPLLGIRREWNPKALGLFLWGYARLYAQDPQPETRRCIQAIIAALKSVQSPHTSGPAWGYNFSWQSRAFYLPRYTPTIVNTAFIGHALLDAYAATGDNEALMLAKPIHRFLLDDLNRTPSGETFCFSYSPLDRTTVHNANLLGASLLARLQTYVTDPSLNEAAAGALAYSMQRQRPDGSWPYAETDYQQWIDSFHTGFNLHALRYLLATPVGAGFGDAYARGVDYYANHFFERNGAPRYYHDRLYPIDIHCPAQAVAFFAGMGSPHEDLTDRVLTWMLDELYDPTKGIFYFRKGRTLTNRISYIRWAQAWAFHALTTYVTVRHTRPDRVATYNEDTLNP
ncbi:MAG: delta-aminolevulinic acid dehydratase [Verrucomicrobia bacterium]|nr:delta-aminolevulinic acid dehydratase [Verrucomicrobiota bacterium]